MLNLLDIPNNLLSDLRTTFVLTPQIAGIDRQSLGAEADDLFGYRSDIIAALDFIISGI